MAQSQKIGGRGAAPARLRRSMHSGHHRPWQRRRWQGIFGSGPVQPDPQVQWAQGCLAQLVDPSLPQNGFLGPRTRQAIQTFQMQQQMPATGALDPDTVAALQEACSGQQGANDTPAAAPPAPPPPAPAGKSGGRRQRELAPVPEDEFRFHRREPRRDRDEDRRGLFMEAEMRNRREEEFRFHRDDRFREHPDRWRRDHDRERRSPFLWEGEAHPHVEREFRFRRDERFREDPDRRRWEHGRERRWPFLWGAEHRPSMEGEFRFRDERFREDRDRWRRDHDRERRWPFLWEGELRFERPLPPFEFRPHEPLLRDRLEPDRRWLPGLPENRRIAWAQSCLAQILGSWVVQDGMMGPNTARALRKFQEQRQLPATGVLDGVTADALHQACGG